MFKSEYWYEVVKYKTAGERSVTTIRDRESADRYAKFLHSTNPDTEYPVINKKLILIPIFNDYSILDVMGDCKSEILINIREKPQGTTYFIQQFHSITRKEKVFFNYAIVDRSDSFDISKIYVDDCIMLHPNYQVYQNLFEYNTMLYNIYKHDFENDVDYFKDLLKEVL